MFFSKGEKTPIEYKGDRSEEDFVAFLNEKCGTQRAVGGGLTDQACHVSLQHHLTWLSISLT